MFDFSRLSLPGPEGRADAIRASLTQIAALPGASDVPIPALAGAFTRLGFGVLDGKSAESTRRLTCIDISEALGATVPEGALLPPASAAYPWFQAQVSAWTGSEDPRLAAMAATAARELGELQAMGS